MELSDFVALRAVTGPKIDIDHVEIADITHRGKFGAKFRELVYVQGLFTEVATKPVSSYIIGYKSQANDMKRNHVEIHISEIDQYEVIKHG